MDHFVCVCLLYEYVVFIFILTKQFQFMFSFKLLMQLLATLTFSSYYADRVLFSICASILKVEKTSFRSYL